MYQIRTFRNSDPKVIMDIWGQVYAEGSINLTPLNTNYLCANVLGLPYFDSKGLFIAFDHLGQPVGFAHATFGPNKDYSDINRETGVICLVLVVPGYEHAAALKLEFIQRCENYLKEHGSKVIFGGSTRSSASFYSGLYGGSEPLGIYENDKELLDAYEQCAYQVQYRTIRFRQMLDGYRPPFTPKSCVWNRRLKIDIEDALPKENWVQSCAMTFFNWYEATGTLPEEPEPIVKVLIRTSAPLDRCGARMQVPLAAALVNVVVNKNYREKGVATFAVGKLIRYLTDEYKIRIVETLALENDLSYVKLAQTLGLKECDRGVVLIKILEERRKNIKERQLLATT